MVGSRKVGEALYLVAVAVVGSRNRAVTSFNINKKLFFSLLGWIATTIT